MYGEIAGPPGAPTVLLYAHYDVQPAGHEAEWTTSPWEPTERDGRLYGRGTADDKCGIAIHAGALRALGDSPPVTIRVIIEGEEETGRGTFGAYVAAHPDRLAADVIVVADSGNWKVGEPTLTTSLRGLAAVDVEVRTLEASVHSGLFGGPCPDAFIALARMHRDASRRRRGRRRRRPRPPGLGGRGVDADDLRESSGMADGVELIGTGSLAERLYMRPSITAIGVDAPAVDRRRQRAGAGRARPHQRAARAGPGPRGGHAAHLGASAGRSSMGRRGDSDPARDGAGRGARRRRPSRGRSPNARCTRPMERRR